MRYLKGFLVLLLLFFGTDYSQVAEDQQLRIQSYETEYEHFAISNSFDDKNYGKALRYQNSTDEYGSRSYFSEEALSSSIYLLIKFQMLIVIKFNTSFYKSFF